MTVSRDGRVLAWLVNDDGYDSLRLRDLESGEDLAGARASGRRTPASDRSEPPIALSHDGSHAALILSRPRRPPEAWVVETETGSARPVTDSRIGGPQEDELVDVELDQLPDLRRSRDPGLALPADGRGQGAGRALDPRRPGGAGAVRSTSPLYQYLLCRGIAVLATNIRGSTGYGKSYQRLVQRDWGGGDMQDWEHAVKWLHEQDWVDPDTDRRLRRLVRRLRRAHLRDAPARVLGGGGRHLRPVEPRHVREGRAAHVEAVHRAVRRATPRRRPTS